MTTTVTQKWYKSPVVWGAFVALIAAILKAKFNIVIGDELSNQAVSLILYAITAFGVINSPTVKNKLG